MRVPPAAVTRTDLSPLRLAYDSKTVDAMPSSNGPGGGGATVRSPVACASQCRRFKGSQTSLRILYVGLLYTPFFDLYDDRDRSMWRMRGWLFLNNLNL